MGEKTTTRRLLVVVLVSFFAFGLAHDMNHGSFDPEATVENEEPIPHFEEICALTLIGALMGSLVLRRARNQRRPVVMAPSQETARLFASRMNEPPRCSGFQLAFPMLA